MPRLLLLALLLVCCAGSAFGQRLHPFFDQATRLYGYKNADELTVIRPAYEEAHAFAAGLAVVRIEDRYLLIDETGEALKGQAYDSLGFSGQQNGPRTFQEGWLGFKIEGKWGLLNDKGKEKVAARYARLYPFKSGRAIVADSCGGALCYGLIESKKGEPATPISYASIRRAAEAFIVEIAGQEGRYGAIGPNGEYILTPDFQGMEPLGEGRFAAQDDNGLWGLYGIKGQRLLPHAYRHIAPFRKGYAILSYLNGHYGLIDRQGQDADGIDNRGIYRIVWTGERYRCFRNKKHVRASGQAGGEQTDGALFARRLYNVGADRYLIDLNDSITLFTDASGQAVNPELPREPYEPEEPFRNGIAMLSRGYNEGVTAIDRQGRVMLTTRRTDEGLEIIDHEPSGLLRLYVYPHEAELSGELGEKSGWQNSYWNRCELYRPDGQNLSNGQYDTIYSTAFGGFEGELFCAKNHAGRWGYLDTDLQTAIPFKYEAAQPFFNGYAPVKRNGHYGVIDLEGQWVLSPHLDFVDFPFQMYLFDKTDYPKDAFVFRHNNYWGIVGADGVERYSGEDERYAFAGKGALRIQKDGLYGLVNQWGALILPPEYEYVSDVRKDSVVTFLRDGKRYFTSVHQDRFDIRLPEPDAYDRYELLDTLTSNGYIPIRENGRYGYIDWLGRLRVATRYDGAEPFSEGLAAVKIGELWGYVDLQDRLPIQPRYQKAEPFKDGLARVTVDGKRGLIDRQGAYVVKPEYDRIEKDFERDFWLVWQNGKIGLVNDQGGEVISPQYDEVDVVSDRFAIVRQREKYGIYDLSKSQISVLPRYDDVRYNQFDGDFFLIQEEELFEVPEEQ